MSDTTTVADALRLHYASSGLPLDGGRSAEQWALKLGPLVLYLDNFQWRRRALVHHDVHHVLTGYACTPAGEFEMAAWEFAAGRFPSLFSTLFCLPLIFFGAVTIPRRSFAAFVCGRRSRTLYAVPLSAELMALQLHELRRALLPATQSAATLRDLFEYAALAGLSLALVITPLAALTALFLGHG